MALPVAGIVCIVLACWVVVVLALFALYRFLKHRGTCECECAPCGTAGGESCSCCKAISDSCDCCNPSLNGCLNSVCPKKKLSCVDIILCQCCAEPGQDSCLVNILPCCTRDCECCDDGCCRCCADCDALVCCCLEIRLVSKSSQEENSPAAKYTPNYSTTADYKSNQNNSAKRDQTISKTDKTAETVKQGTKSVSSVRSSGIKSNQSTPRTQTTARSVSQLQLSYTSSNSNQQKVGKPTTKMKPPPGTSRKADKKSNTESTRSLPAPPTFPSKSNISMNTKLKTGTRKRTSSEPSASELKEVPIKQQSVLLHSHLYESTYSLGSGNFHGGSDFMQVLHPHFDATSQTLSLDASSVNLQSYSSLPPLSPGTILDGAGTHRSSGAGSTFSVHFEDFNPLASPRPLPGLPGR